MKVSDMQLNAMVRSVLAKHWVDLQKIKIELFRGSVRLRGELCQRGTRAPGDADASFLETIVSEIKRIQGVRRVYFVGLVLPKECA